MLLSRAFFHRVAAGLAAAAFLAACSSGSSGGGLVPARATERLAKPRHDAKVLFRLKLSRHGKRAKYLSPQTRSIVVRVFDATHTVEYGSSTDDTLPGMGTCTALAGGTFTCAFAVGAPLGYDTFDVEAYDATKGTGNALSATSDFPFDVVAGKANAIAMTLGGIPASIAVSLLGSSPYATGNAVAGFQFGGTGTGAAQRLRVTAYDADGYAIVAPGLPGLSITSGDARVAVIPVSGSPGEFSVEPLEETNALPDASASVTLVARATPQVGSAISADVGVQFEPVLFVQDYSTTIYAYVPWSTTPVWSIDDGGEFNDDSWLALDAKGNLYTTNYSGQTLSVYPPASITYSRRIALPFSPISGLAVDPGGDIFVSENGAQVQEFAPGSATPTRTLGTKNGLIEPYGLALDAAGNLYVADDDAGVAIFPPGTSTKATHVMTVGIDGAWQLCFDKSGMLYVVNYSGNSVTSYKPPFTNTTPVNATFGAATFYEPYTEAIDGSGNLWVADYGHWSEFSPSSPASPTRTIASSTYAYYFALDALGYVYLAAYASTNPITIYSPQSGLSSVASYQPANDTSYVIAWP